MEERAFASADELEAWLESNHESEDGVWIKFAKKGSGIASATYAEAVELALCFGWIDGQAERLDDDWYLQRFTPRRKRSNWSKINTERRARAREEPGRQGVLRLTGRDEPLRAALPDPGGQAGRHPRAPHREVRGHAQPRREDPPLGRSSAAIASMRTRRSRLTPSSRRTRACAAVPLRARA